MCDQHIGVEWYPVLPRMVLAPVLEPVWTLLVVNMYVLTVGNLRR